MRMNEVQKGGPTGLPVLLWLLTGLAVTLISLAVVSIAVAAPPVSVAQPPMILPETAGISGATTPDQTGPGQPGSTGDDAIGYRHWIIGTTPGAKTGKIAARFKAKPAATRLGIYRVRATSATAFARQLDRAGRLIYAEPDTATAPAGYPLDPQIPDQWWLSKIVSPFDTAPPAVTQESPLIGIIEQALDPDHPGLIGANLTGAVSIDPVADSHGTSVAAIIGSPGLDRGIRGVWPGARMRHFPSGNTCLTSSRAVWAAARRGAFVINMSYTFPAGSCYTHYVATEFAVSRGALPVAAAGNSGSAARVLVYPAADPHVLSVSAVDRDNLVADFATRNSRVDLTAPGKGILAPITAPVATVGEPCLGDDEHRWACLDGTSFSAPMVTAAAAWLKQVRPRLTARQAGRLLTNSATDLGDPGRDPEYGEGLLNIDNALATRNPPHDPLEPNDDIPFLDGSILGRQARFIWKPRGRRVARLRATLSRRKDPVDIYRVRIRGRQQILVTASQLEGDVLLAALKPATRTIKQLRKKVIVRSDRPSPKTEGVRIRNLGRRARNLWILVQTSRRQTGEYSDYRLTVRAQKRKRQRKQRHR